MAAPNTQRKPAYLWPFAAILGPMLLLAVMAAWTLKADRRSVEQEARTRAAELAQSVLAAAERSLNAIQFKPDNTGFSVAEGRDIFIVDKDFRLISPPPSNWPPTPQPLSDQDFARLPPVKIEQWVAAEAAATKGDWQKAHGLYREFLELETRHWHQTTNDNDALAASRLGPIASLRYAAVEEKAFEQTGTYTPEAAINSYNWIFARFWRGDRWRAESGVSFVPLAVLKILEMAKGRVELLPPWWRENPESLVLELANTDASPLTEEAIRQLRTLGNQLAASAQNPTTVDKLFTPWDKAMRARRFYNEAAKEWMGMSNLLVNSFWRDVGETRWLALQQELPLDYPTAGREQIFVALTEDWLRDQLYQPFNAESKASPFIAVVQVAGEPITLAHAPVRIGSPGAQTVDERRVIGAVMAEVAATKLPVRVSIGLKDPDLYFASVRRRQFMLATLVVLAVVAGFVAAWILRRSLLKQLGLNEQKSNFVSSVSHELRAPIASVRLMAESLERGNVTEPEKQREYFRFIGQECRRLSALIANVLDFARIEQGRKQYEFEPTDLNKLVSETVRLMQPYAEERGVKLKGETFNVQRPTSNVQGEVGDTRNLKLGTCNLEPLLDGHAIQQALVNLIDNAIKHSPAGESVIVALGLSEDGTRNTQHAAASPPINHQPSTINLSVSDSGPGIPASEREKIFERFYRLGSELRRETQGVGIGLSIVKHIVEAHGGRVLVEGHVGQGSRFTIELPGKNSTTDGHR